MKRDSFTRKVKEELVSNSYDSFDRLRALLAAYIRINGSLIIRNKSTVLSLKNENAKISKFLYETISQIYKTKVNLLTKKKPNLSKSVSYIIEIEEASEEIIDDLEISFPRPWPPRPPGIRIIARTGRTCCPPAPPPARWPARRTSPCRAI